MEKGALVGMMGLASCDFLFCLLTISGTFQPSNQMIYHSKNFTYYYTLYGNYFHNVLIKTSTWFTVILAVSRHFVVSYPIRARQFMRCGQTLIAILICIFVWILLHIPLFYLWKPTSIQCLQQRIHFLQLGAFQNNSKLKMTFCYIWFFSGFVIPVCILAFCNTRLIHYLHRSRQLLAQEDTWLSPSNRSHDHNQRRISINLVAIVTMFFLLILPSEIAAFYVDCKDPNKSDGLLYFLTFCNLLQVLNFSGNFLLYCICNAYFRKTLAAWLMCVKCCHSNGHSRTTNIELTTRKVSTFMYLSAQTTHKYTMRKSATNESATVV